MRGVPQVPKRSRRVEDQIRLRREGDRFPHERARLRGSEGGSEGHVARARCAVLSPVDEAVAADAGAGPAVDDGPAAVGDRPAPTITTRRDASGAVCTAARLILAGVAATVATHRREDL